MNSKFEKPKKISASRSMFFYQKKLGTQVLTEQWGTGNLCMM